MSRILFYEKPGCINNSRQKALLTAAGHQVIAHSLLTEAWTAERLRPFFGDRPIAEWFNRTAPTVKSGEVIPEAMDEASALAAMVANPLLIRRPLMQVGDRYHVGFDLEEIDAWLGLVSDRSQDLQTCPHSQSH